MYQQKQRTMTEEQIQGLGFTLDKEYNHDKFITKRYTKGVLEVEFTYSGENLKTVDLTITEVNCKPVTLSDMKALTPILGLWND